MKKQESLVVRIGVVFILTAVLFLSHSLPVSAAGGCNIISIYDRGNITPKKVTAKKGDCVLWVNWKDNENVTLVFKDGEKCMNAVKTPVDFKLDAPKGCFLSQELMYGNSVSLLFMEPGTYEYEILFSVGGKESAVITVTE